MAKICKPIIEYKEVLAGANINLSGEYRIPKRLIKRFVHFMKPVDDKRVAGMVSYPLREILVIAFLAILAGASGWCDMEMFGKARRNRKWLRKILPLKNGTPSHDTFRAVFALIDPTQFALATASFVIERLDTIRKALKPSEDCFKLICIDGKEQKGSGRKHGTDENVKNLQTLHVLDASDGVCLFSVPIGEKTNEIPTAQGILKGMDLNGCIVTFDSMNTQKDTIDIIAGKGGHYVAARGGNHPLMHDEIMQFLDADALATIRKGVSNYFETTEKAHNRLEKRSFYLSKSAAWLSDHGQWRNLKSVVCYVLATEDLVTHKTTQETRYYISSLSDVQRRQCHPWALVCGILPLAARRQLWRG
jgi:predicted transposase YbfD/YdcC